MCSRLPVVMVGFPDGFTTKRLVLRPIEAADSDAAFDVYAADPRVTRYLTWTPYVDPGVCAKFFAQHVARHANGEIGAYAITLRETRRLIGAFDLRPDADCRVNFGYALGRAFWRRGYMTEALSEVVAWALAQPDIWRVWGVTDVENNASVGVMERAGLVREGVLRRWSRHPNVSTDPRDCFCYARVR